MIVTVMSTKTASQVVMTVSIVMVLRPVVVVPAFQERLSNVVIPVMRVRFRNAMKVSMPV